MMDVVFWICLTFEGLWFNSVAGSMMIFIWTGVLNVCYC